MYDPLAVTLPVARYRVTPHGEYAFVRSADVTHWGLDMRPDVTHDWCVAPEHGVVRYVDRDGAGDASPLTNYGPGSLIIEGALGFSHVLGHLDPATIPDHIVPGYVVRCGERVGRIDRGPNHVHWEVRTELLPPRGAARGRLTWHPLRWLAMRQLAAGAATGLALVTLPLVLVVGLGVVAGLASGVTRGEAA